MGSNGINSLDHLDTEHLGNGHLASRHLDSRHLHVEIEPTNLCNTVCLHCPHDAISRPSGKMDWETYQAAIDQVIEYTPHRNFEYAGMGEPLLNPLIYQFIDYVRDLGPTSLTTNASALTQNNIERLIQSGLSHLTISFNGEDRVVYEMMMGGLDFDRAQKNLSTAVAMSQGTQLVVGANVSVTRQTQDRLTDIKRFLNEAGITDIYFSKCHNRGGFLKGNLICTTPPPPVEKHRCDIFSNTLFIAWTGEVLSCCHDLAGKTTQGNLRNERLETILDKKNQITSEGVRFDICNNCNDLYRFMNDRPINGRNIGDWVYELYAQNDASDEPGNTSLNEWLYTLYAQESQEKRFFNIVAEKIEEQEQQIIQDKTNRDAEVNSLRAQLEEIRDSRSWQMIQKLQHFRLVMIPKGSRREVWFNKLVSMF
jgi:hypothetical protein